jgi:hypothetical protein
MKKKSSGFLLLFYKKMTIFLSHNLMFFLSLTTEYRQIMIPAKWKMISKTLVWFQSFIGNLVIFKKIAFQASNKSNLSESYREREAALLPVMLFIKEVGYPTEMYLADTGVN